jgi:nucleoside-diphosphate-sugar epimerase
MIDVGSANVLTRPSQVAVLGHTGFIGRRLERRLKEAGVSVRGFSRSSGFDIRNDDLTLAGVDHVFHLAGLSYVPDSWSDPVSHLSVNGHGTVRVLDQCRRAGVPLTYVSSAIYGPTTRLPITEATPVRPSSPYAFSKLQGEEACRFFGNVYDVKVGILRLFNVYGPGQDNRFLIPTIARQVLDPRVDEIVVADLSPRRDYVYVDEVVDALVLAPGFPPGTVFNVGSGQSRSVADVIEACLAAAGVSKPYRETGNRRVNEVPDAVADISAIASAGGWRPRVSFDSGIRSLLESITRST